jgi:anaerobic C4-dicarboxylate transporter
MNPDPSLQKSSTARWVLTLSLLTALFWVVVAVAYLLRPWQTDNPMPIMKWIIAFLMLCNAAVIVWLGQRLLKQAKPFYYLALGYLAVNILLTIFDDFGMADLIYLLYAGALFVLLLVSKRKFTGLPQ